MNFVSMPNGFQMVDIDSHTRKTFQNMFLINHVKIISKTTTAHQSQNESLAFVSSGTIEILLSKSFEVRL